MPPRLSHRKSIKGCSNCKRRKVKCDEAQPRCGACTRHDVPCEYPVQEFRLIRPSQLTQPVSAEDLLERGAIAGGPPPCIDGGVVILDELDCQLQLRLLHYFTAFTSQSFTSAGKLWRVRVPHLAFGDPALLYAVLGVAALHLARDQTECQVYLPNMSSEAAAHISRVCFDQALIGHRSALSELGQQNVESTYFGAILISLHSLVLMGGTCEAEGAASEALWFSLGAGVRQIATIWCKTANQNVFGPSGIFHEEPDLTDETYLFDWAHAEPFRWLHDSLLELDVIPKDDRQALKDTLSCLGLIYTAILRKSESSRESCRRIIALPARLPPTFNAAVVEGRPWALVVVSRIFGVMRLLEDDIFWFRDIAHLQITAIARRMSPDLHHLLELPGHISCG